MQAEIGSPARQFYVSSSHFAELALTGSAAQPRLVASLQTGIEEIWTISLSAKGLVATGNAQRIVESTAGEGHRGSLQPAGWLSEPPEWHVSIWLAGRTAQIRVANHIAVSTVRLLSHWSPDGQFLVFHARFPGEPQLYVVHWRTEWCR